MDGQFPNVRRTAQTCRSQEREMTTRTLVTQSLLCFGTQRFGHALSDFKACQKV